jgi:hypothetical protein
MMKTFAALTLAAAAAALAAPASAEPVRVQLAGKTPAAAFRAIEIAAHQACRLPTGQEIYTHYIYTGCVRETVQATVAKITQPAFVQYVQSREAFLVASR